MTTRCHGLQAKRAGSAINGSETTLSATESAKYVLLSSMPLDLALGASHNAPNYPSMLPLLSSLLPYELVASFAN